MSTRWRSARRNPSLYRHARGLPPPLVAMTARTEATANFHRRTSMSFRHVATNPGGEARSFASWRHLVLAGKRPGEPHLQRVHSIGRHRPIRYREDGRLSGREVGGQLVGT